MPDTDGPGIEELRAMPPLGRSFRRAAFGGLLSPVPVLRRQPAPGPLPTLLVRQVTVDGGHLARYREVCGFPIGTGLPPTYPHVLAFPLAMELMTRPGFPFPLPGLVHLSNHCTRMQPLRADDPYDITVAVEGPRAHERGRAVDLVTRLAVGSVTVWQERSVYLRVGGRPTRSTREPAPTSEPPEPAAVWPVGADVGPAYARVSGDRNPIHTSDLAARLFGFPRRIAHGMWTLARCLAALDPPATRLSTVDATFKLPVLLPGTIVLTTDGPRFALHDPSGRPHLTATAT
jgi:MaoC dehydratase-like protein